MKRFRPRLLPILLAVQVVLAATPAARAGTTAEPDSKVGVIAAILCGFGIRYIPVLIELGPGGIAGEISACGLMVVDALITREN